MIFVKNKDLLTASRCACRPPVQRGQILPVVSAQRCWTETSMRRGTGRGSNALSSACGLAYEY